MYRTETEIKLFIIRQRCYDILTQCIQEKVTKLDIYKQARVGLEVCEVLLNEYQQQMFKLNEKTMRV